EYSPCTACNCLSLTFSPAAKICTCACEAKSRIADGASSAGTLNSCTSAANAGSPEPANTATNNNSTTRDRPFTPKRIGLRPIHASKVRVREGDDRHQYFPHTSKNLHTPIAAHRPLK